MDDYHFLLFFSHAPACYFMVANDNIRGTGDNMFSPRALTLADEARNYTTATREQALKIAVHMVENMGK